MSANATIDLCENLARRALSPSNASHSGASASNASPSEEAQRSAVDWNAASPSCLDDAFDLLGEHRLHLLVYSRLSQSERTDHLHPELHEDLEEVYRAQCSTQGLLELSFAQVTHALSERGIPSISCKGMVLAQDYYQPKGVRPMQDIDLWVPHDDLSKVRATLADVGFQEKPEKETPHALYFENPLGALLDVHHRMALFEAQRLDPFELTTRPLAGWHRVFQPEPLLVHLVFHLLGHAGDVGILLGWVTDIAVVLNRHGDAIDWEKVRLLCPTERVFKVMMRLVALAVEMGWSRPPEPLQGELRAAASVSFGKLIRLRHLAPLHLNRVRGWARLLKRFQKNGQQLPPIPPWNELPRGFLDLIAEGTRLTHSQAALMTGEERVRRP